MTIHGRDETEDRLRGLWADHSLSRKQIAKRIGITYNALVGRSRRMKLPSRPEDARKPVITDRRSHRKRPPTAAPDVTVSPDAVAPAPLPETFTTAHGHVREFRYDDPHRPPIANATLATTVEAFAATPLHTPAPLPRSADCQFPLNGRRPWRFCEAPTKPGSVYCARHHSICYHRSAGAVA